MKQRTNTEVEPHVGIFWLYDGQLLLDSTPLSKAEPYADSLTHPTGHVDYWDELHRRGAVPLDVEYEHPPRGRVGYDKREERFFLRADKCILDRKTVVRKIMAEFNLPQEKTSVGCDDHYRCPECMKRRHRCQP